MLRVIGKKMSLGANEVGQRFTARFTKNRIPTFWIVLQKLKATLSLI